MAGVAFAVEGDGVGFSNRILRRSSALHHARQPLRRRLANKTGYHHHPHRPEEFDSMPRDMAGQARAALENLKRGLEAVGAAFADVVTADRFVTDLTDQDALNRIWGEYFRDAKPATTTVQVVRLATDPRCMVEINAVAVVD
jgi:enamine deaminase RidA (YjgF/YER057c/UK114 family)